MRLPSGYGSVHKLSGNRRNPWRARVTTGWTDEGKQIYATVGYYPTQTEALKALSNYHLNPYSLEPGATFRDIYDKWSAEKYNSGISESNIKAYKASFKSCESLYNMKFGEIKKSHLQGVVDNCGKNYPTLRKLKVLFSQLYSFAMENDICEKDYSEYVDIVKHKEKKKEEKHKPFTEKEISLLWDNADRNDYIKVFLMLIYSGVRISELLDLKKEDVNLEEQWFDVVDSKTEAGIRKVPIADKVLPYFERWMKQSTCEYLLCTPAGSHFVYSNYYDTYWTPLMDELGMKHFPHDTRHTTITLLAKAKVSQTLIKRIVGHKGAMSLTERVYTHTDIAELIDAINNI